MPCEVKPTRDVGQNINADGREPRQLKDSLS